LVFINLEISFSDGRYLSANDRNPFASDGNLFASGRNLAVNDMNNYPTKRDLYADDRSVYSNRFRVSSMNQRSFFR